MNPQILFEIARIEHQNRVRDAQQQYQRRQALGRRRRWSAFRRPPSRRHAHALAA